MTLMRILGKTKATLAVTCDAEMRLPNTDVMFVLDTYGLHGRHARLAACPNPKIGGLKTAVKCFYEIVARFPTNADVCHGQAERGDGRLKSRSALALCPIQPT